MRVHYRGGYMWVLPKPAVIPPTPSKLTYFLPFLGLW